MLALADTLRIYSPFDQTLRASRRLEEPHQAEPHGLARGSSQSQDQYDKIMNMANCDGDRPVIDADLQVNYAQGHRIISNSISRPDIAFDSAQHKAMLKQVYAAKDYEQKLRADAREIKQFENDIFR